MVRGTFVIQGLSAEDPLASDDFLDCCDTDLNPTWSPTSTPLQSSIKTTIVGFAGTVLHFSKFTFPDTQ